MNSLQIEIKRPMLDGFFLHHAVQIFLVCSWKIAEQTHKFPSKTFINQRHSSVMFLMNRSRWTFRFGLRGGQWIGLIASQARKMSERVTKLV